MRILLSCSTKCLFSHLYTYLSLKGYIFPFRPVGSGAAWRRSPHQKSAGRERERERKKRKRREERNRKEEKEKRGEKGMKGRGDQERKMYYTYIGVKHPLITVKRLLKTRKEGGLKKQEERKRRQKRPEKKW